MLRIVDWPEYSPDELKARVDLRALVAPEKPIRGDRPVKVWCLWHEEHKAPSLAVWADRMHCFGCGRSMDLIDFVMWREGIDDYHQALAVVAEKYVGSVPLPPPKRERVVHAPSPLSADIAEYYHCRLGKRREWFRQRGLLDETIDREKLGYERQAFTIPVWSADGKLLTIRYRRDDEALGENAETRSKYWGIQGRNGPLLYNASALDMVSDAGFVVICEGELDALRLVQEGIPAISSTGGAATFDSDMARQVKLAEPPVVYVAYDQDLAGRLNGVRVARLFGLRGRVVRWDESLGKDVTDFMRRYSVDDFLKLLLAAREPQRIENPWKKEV